MEKYVQPFISACEGVFENFIGTALTAERPYFAAKGEINEWDISSVIGFTGEAKGAVVLSMKWDLAMKITDAITGKKHTEVDEEVIDAIGEIVNIIAGNAKLGLEEMFRLVISLPTIIQGVNHTVNWPNENARIISIPFKVYGSDIFNMSVAIEKSEAIDNAKEA